MKLRCLLIDDEPPALQLLSSYIGNIDSLEIVGQCKNALEALTVLNEKNSGRYLFRYQDAQDHRHGFYQKPISTSKSDFCDSIP